MPSDSSPSDIKSSYLSKAKVLHPDLNPDTVAEAERLMAEVTEAFGVLSDEVLRGKYDNGVADLVLNSHEEDYYSSVVSKSM